MDDPLIVNPKGAYFTNLTAEEIPHPCWTWLTNRISVIHPRYIVRLDHFPCILGDFENITYSAWLPPFKRYVYILHLPASQPAKAP